MINRRAFSLAATSGLLPLASTGLQAQTLPKTVRILVGFPPGGSADLLARALAQQLGSDLGAGQ